MRKLLYSLGVMLTLGATSAMFTACSGDDVPDCCRSVKEAHVYATLYVNEDFAEAFDVYGQTQQGEKLSLSSSPTLVSIDGEELSMYTLTVEKKGRQLPLSTSVIVSYKRKETGRSPECHDFIIAAESHGDITYKDGKVDNISSQWCYGPHKSDWHNVCSSDPHQDIDSYESYLHWYFSELDGCVSHGGFYFTTSNKHWCGTPSSSEHHK